MALRIPRGLRSRRTGKILLGIAAFLLVLSGIAAWQVPKVVRSALTQNVAELLGRPVDVGAIRFNPFTLTLRADELSIAQPDAAPLLTVDRIEASASWMSLFWLAPVVDAVTVRRPLVKLAREDALRLNVADIQKRLAQRAAESPPSGDRDEGLPRFSLNNLVLEDGAVTLDDRLTGRRHVIDEIALGVPFVSNFGYATDIDVEPLVRMRINGSPLRLDGVALPFDETPSSTLNLAFRGLELEKFADAWPAPLPVRLERALLDSDLQLLFEQPRDAPARIRIVGDLGLRQLDLRESSGEPLLQWDMLSVRRIAMEPLARALHIGEVELESSRARTRRDADQRVNWLVVFEQLQQLGAGKKPDSRGPAASEPAPPEPVAAAPDASSPADAPADAAAPADETAADAPAPEPAAPSSDTGAWRIGVDAINIRDASLQLRDAATRLDYTLSGLSATVEALELPQPEERPILLWLNMDDGRDGAWLRAKGPLMLQPLSLQADLSLGGLALAPFAPVVRSVSPVLVEDGVLSLSGRIQAAERQGAVQVSATGVKAGLARFAARDEAVSPAVPLRVEQLDFAADRLALDAARSPFSLQASGIQGAGRLALRGELAAQPASLAASVELADLDVAPFAPYAAGSLNATVRSLSVGARGQAEFSAAAGGAPMKAGWKGAVEVTDLDLADRVNNADFLNWKRLAMDGMAVSAEGERFAADLGDVTLDDFYGRILLNAEGRLNVMDLVTEPGQAGGSITQDTQTQARAAPAPAAPGERPDIAVRSVALKNGRMTFTDRFIKPNYTAELSQIAGSLSAVSSRHPAPAKVNVTGRVYGTAPLAVSGTVQPFAEYLSLDLRASAKGVDLPRFTTYSAKYVGYPIQRGKLSMDVAYRIKNRELQASNRVLLNQLTFGNKTDSPDAIKLPVLLAVALLKDRQGNIDINLPVSGSLDDPQFSVGGIVLRVLVNLLVKAVTSPFALLASAFGGGEELSYIDFEPGSARLEGEAETRLGTLAKALAERPALKLDIAGRADPETDMQGLRQAWLEMQLRTAKAKATAKRGSKPDPAGVEVAAAERAKYLEAVYDDTDLEGKPRNFLGFAKSVPAEQMESMLLEAAPVESDDLRKLADARAQAVYERLQQEIPAERLFIVAPVLDGAPGEGEARPSRVDFSLK